MANAEGELLEVLVADDSAALRNRVIEILSAIEGIKVIGGAQNAADTMRSIQALRPRAVILDIQMPDESGLEVLRKVKREFPETVVVILTNHAEPQYQQKCAELKADHFLSKSTDWKTLIEIAKQLVQARKSDDV